MAASKDEFAEGHFDLFSVLCCCIPFVLIVYKSYHYVSSYFWPSVIAAPPEHHRRGPHLELVELPQHAHFVEAAG